MNKWEEYGRPGERSPVDSDWRFHNLRGSHLHWESKWVVTTVFEIINSNNTAQVAQARNIWASASIGIVA